MRRLYPLVVVTLILLFNFDAQAQQRYLSEVFSNVTVTQDVQYAENITVITGMPNLENLVMDVYEPAGDTETERPVIIIAHSGEYLPNPVNGLTYGEKTDSAVVHLCRTLAKRGFVAVAYSYRLGWNPSSFSQEIRTGTYLNAHYRATQDGFSVLRYLRMDADTQGNTFGIDTSRMISGGMGTGGQISASMAFLDRQEEWELAKFFDPNTNQSYIDTSLSGNVYGTLQRPLTVSNNPSYSNDFHFAFNLGGYVLDSSWVEAGDVPMVGFHSPNDPFAPYDFGAAIITTTGDFLINCSGSKGIQRRQNLFGNNGSYAVFTYSDVYTTQANLINSGMDGLYPFIRPTTEDSPWNYWDASTWNIPHPNGGTFHDNGLLTNPDMSAAKGKTYLDTVVNYLSPRIVCALNLPGCPGVGLDELAQQIPFSVQPNPFQDELTLKLHTSISNDVAVVVRNQQGQIVHNATIKGITENTEVTIDLSHVSEGMYFVSLLGTSIQQVEKVIKR